MRRIDKNCNSRITALRIFTTRADLATINRSPIIFSKLPLVIHFQSIIISQRLTNPS